LKLSDIGHALVRIFKNRDVLLTIVLFGVGLLLASVASGRVLEERVEGDTLEEGDDIKIEAKLSRPYDDESDDGSELGLKNATLELRSETENTKANISILLPDGHSMNSWEIKEGENKTIDLTEYHRGEHIKFEIEEGRLSYTYTVNEYTQPYYFLSIPAFILLALSLIFIIRAVALMGPLTVDKEEKDKKRKNQKVVEGILKDRGEEGNREKREKERHQGPKR